MYSSVAPSIARYGTAVSVHSCTYSVEYRMYGIKSCKENGPTVLPFHENLLSYYVQYCTKKYVDTILLALPQHASIARILANECS